MQVGSVLSRSLILLILGTIIYRIAGNFQGRKFSQILQFFSHPRKFSPQNSRHVTLIMRPVLTFRKCSFPTDPRKFSPSKISCYTVCMIVHVCVSVYFTLYDILSIKFAMLYLKIFPSMALLLIVTSFHGP